MESVRHVQYSTGAGQSLVEIPTPQSKLPLWPHQEEAFRFAFPKEAVLCAMDMGTGKSAVAVALLNTHDLAPVLILCPKSVVPVWPKEFAKHSSHPYRVLAYPDNWSVARKAQDAARWLAIAGRTVLVLNYEACWREPMAKLLGGVGWGAIVCDESHRIKSHNGKASRYLGRLRTRARYRYCLTGTPLPHSPLDAFGQFRFLDPRVFGTSVTRFRNRYAEMGGYGGYEVKRWIRQDEFNARFYSLTTRCLAEDVLDLPDYGHTERVCFLEPKAARLYRELEALFYAEVEAGTVTVSNALTKLLRLQQLTSGYLPLDDGTLQQVSTAKAKLLRDVLENDIPPEEPVVIFCRFRSDLDTVQAVGEALGRPVAELSGRARQLAEWQAGEYTLLAAQLQAGGVGVDLTRSHYQIYYSLGYSLGDYEQSLKRVHRPGQEHAVSYITLTAQGTVDEKVRDALARRKSVIDAILEERS